MQVSAVLLHRSQNIKALAKVLVERWGPMAALKRAQELFSDDSSRTSYYYLVRELEKF